MQSDKEKGEIKRRSIVVLGQCEDRGGTLRANPGTNMRADVSLSMTTSSLKPNVAQLRLNLKDVSRSEDDEEEAVGRAGHTKGLHNVGLARPPSVDEVGGDLPELPHAAKQKTRSQSAKRPPQNGHSVTGPESPLSNKTNVPLHRPVPPKSAPSLRQRGLNKIRTVKSRDQSGSGEPAERQPRSPSPQRPATRTQAASGGRRLSRSQPRRRLTSRSEDLNSSCGDPQSPRLSLSDQQQLSLNGTMSSDGSDDVRHLSVPASPVVGRGLSSSASGAWDVFEEHVRTIHDSSDMYSRFQGPFFKASSTFQETMMELYGHPDYSPHPPGPSIHNVATRGMAVAGAASRFLRLRKKSTVPAEGPEREVDRQTVENAKRGWRVLKQYVQENYTSKRTSQAALSWSMLRHTLKGLSDREKTRMDLYRRYGIVPTLGQDGNLVMVNSMLSERARQAIASGSRHPLLAHNSKTLPQALHKASLPTALSTSSLLSPRSSGDGSGRQRRARSSVTRGSARSDVRISVNRTGGASAGAPLRNGTLRKSAEFMTRSPNRSHTP